MTSAKTDTSVTGGKFASGAESHSYMKVINLKKTSKKSNNQSDIKFTYGVQGGFRVGLSKLLGLKLEADPVPSSVITAPSLRVKPCFFGAKKVTLNSALFSLGNRLRMHLLKA